MGTGKGLTSIRVPGKNSRDQRRRNGKIAHLKTSRPQGRPMMNLHDLKSRSRSSTPLSAAGRKSKKPRTLLHIKSRRKMSAIERLPVEILQRIFLMDRNISLPRASPIIAAKLSSEYIYDQCLLQTYSIYWEKSINDLLPHYHEYDAEEPSKEQQSAILRCRWFNIERIRRVENQWLAQRYQIGKKSGWQPRLQMVELRYKKLTDDFFDEDWECFKIWIPDMEYHNWNEWGIRSGDENGFLDMERPALLTFRKDMVEIPGGLVNGEWTEEKLKLLFYLWRAGARIEKCSSTAGEEAQAGLREAITSANIHAVYLLIKLKIYIPLTTQLICQFLENCYYSSRGSIYTENYDVFKTFFRDCGYCKWYRGDGNSEGVNAIARKREDEVEREVLELRKQAAGEGKRKKLLNWEVEVLEDIYSLKKM